MKIGILTFHSQLNYGGVLQCWALQTVLEKLGHEVVVIDRWHNADNSLLERGYNKFGLKQWANFWIRSFLGLGNINQWLRVRRTKKFLRYNIKRTPCHFVDWKDAPKDLSVDMLVVGSDQIWHCGDWGDPTAYLLEGAPTIPAIAYAASFGMTELPQGFVELFKRGLWRFKAISCREAEGVEICRRLGFNATHVVDPTLLTWGANAEVAAKSTSRRELVCYFLSERIEDHIVALESFARANKCRVRIFVDDAYYLPFPKNLETTKKYAQGRLNRLYPHVKIADSSGPQDFLDAFKRAKWVVSDSFHALMFSICNGCDVRMIKPTSPFRQKMFARIEEFSIHARGSLIVNSVSAALASFSSGERVSFDNDWLVTRCDASQSWLQSAINSYD